MILFATTGSWGEIAPLLALALMIKRRGMECEFATGPEWADKVAEYLPVHRIGKPMQLSEFTATEFINQLNGWEALNEIKHDLLVSAFFLDGDIHTAVTPYWHTQGMPIRKQTLGLYPSFLHADCGILCCGYPRLSPLKSDNLPDNYVLVSHGTVTNSHDVNSLDIVDAGNPWINDHLTAMKMAKHAIIHAGVGTLADAVEAKTPIIVKPVAYDQHYNAKIAIRLGAGIDTPGVVNATNGSCYADEVLLQLC